MRAQTAPEKEDLSTFECIYGRLFLHRDIVIDPEALELTSYATQLSAFQQALAELPGGDSWASLWVKQASIWARNKGPDKNIGIWGPIPWAPLEGPYQVILSSPTAVKVPGTDLWAHHIQGKRWHPDQN